MGTNKRSAKVQITQNNPEEASSSSDTEVSAAVDVSQRKISKPRAPSERLGMGVFQPFSGVNGEGLAGGKPATPAALPSTAVDDKEYWVQIRGLNCSFKSSIEGELKKDPFVDLGELFEEYRRHRQEITKKLATTQPAAVEPKPESHQKPTPFSFPSIPSLPPFSFQAPATDGRAPFSFSFQAPSNPGNVSSDDEILQDESFSSVRSNTDLIKTGVGEEDEVAIAESRAKLHQLDKEKGWVDLGIGLFKVNRQKPDGSTGSKSRVLCRAEGSGKILLNAAITRDVVADYSGDGKKEFSLLCVNQDAKIAKYLVRTKEASSAKALYDAVQLCVAVVKGEPGEK